MHDQQSQRNKGGPIDAVSRIEALGQMLASHAAAAKAVSGAVAEIDAAAELIASTVTGGGKLVYAAAGSSGLMALADACELPGTFGIPQGQIRIAMAGGVPADGRMPGDTEDQTTEAVAIAREMQPGDIAIVLSASGTTRYACAFAEEAGKRGSKVIGIANVPGSRLLALSDIAIAIPTDAEVVAGSTRLGAGTAQKIALNMISTQAGILLGHVHDGLMVNLNPDNIKLRTRAADIVVKIAHVTSDAATRALGQAGYDTKLAVLIASGMTKAEASALLEQNNHRLRDCMTEMSGGEKTTN